MFNPFKGRKIKCPIDEETRIWIENSMIWLINQFGENIILSGKMLTPTSIDFPVQGSDSKISVAEIIRIISERMNLNKDLIEVIYFNNRPQANFGSGIIPQNLEGDFSAAGHYHGIANGKFVISLDVSQTNNPENLIATISHEMAHIKILGENRLTEIDEHLTDLATVFFGIGIFNANASFQFHSDSDKWGYSQQGYLTQQEWAYALAIYAYIQNNIQPDWIEYLTNNIKADFTRSIEYILENPDKVLV